MGAFMSAVNGDSRHSERLGQELDKYEREINEHNNFVETTATSTDVLVKMYFVHELAEREPDFLSPPQKPTGSTVFLIFDEGGDMLSRSIKLQTHIPEFRYNTVFVQIYVSSNTFHFN